ncbi:21795_t:CDS:2 [Entrophospora sp. SA101]|nr:21795_t:CDS:2 [Entrophospora sp. SA101]
MNSLGVVYRANGKAWMTAMLKQFDERMNGRRVLLLLDNAPCHIVRGMELQNTQAIKFIKFAWTDGVSVNTIVNCWRHTGIINFSNEEEIEQGKENSDENLNEEEDSDEESELPAIPIKEGLEALEKAL